MFCALHVNLPINTDRQLWSIIQTICLDFFNSKRDTCTEQWVRYYITHQNCYILLPSLTYINAPNYSSIHIWMQNVFIVHCSFGNQRNKKKYENKISIPCKADGSKDRQNISGNIVANITTMSANREDLLFDKISNTNKQM